MTLLLASTSPFRQALLRQVGIPFEARSPQIDERALPGLSPRDLALHLAREKARAVAKRAPDRWVVAADQTAELEGALLRKAETREEARAQLARLSGRTHYLHSAVTLWRGAEGALSAHVESVRMTMRALSAREIAAYLDTNEWEGCVGCYRVEARGLLLFDKIEGDHHAIIGLPMLALCKMLREAGLTLL